VNQPENTSAGRIFWLTFLGVTIPCIHLELLGMAFTTVPAYQNKGGGDLLAEVVQPLDGFATFLLVLLALSVVANNIPNDYRHQRR
jgi:purine-cytosine permease-like protein